MANKMRYPEIVIETLLIYREVLDYQFSEISKEMKREHGLVMSKGAILGLYHRCRVGNKKLNDNVVQEVLNAGD